MRAQCTLEFLGGIDGNHLDADIAYGVVIHATRRSRRHDFGLVQTPQVGYAKQLLGITACHAGSRDVLESSGATRRDHSPFRTGQLSQPVANRIRQFVQLDEVLRRRIHRGAHFGQFDRCSDDREGAPAIDDRVDADRLVDFGSGL
jgi:hypothetical protein